MARELREKGVGANGRMAKLVDRYREAALAAHGFADALSRAVPTGVDDPELPKLFAALQRADSAAAEGEFEAALKAVESIVEPLARRARDRGIEAASATERPAAVVARTLARAAFAAAYRLGPNTTQVAKFDRATRRFSSAEKLLAAGAFAEAALAFREVSAELGATTRDAGETAVERFAALAKRRGELVNEIRRLPTRKFTQKQRENALGAIRRFDSAARAGDELMARSALDECGAFLDERHAEPSSASRPSPTRSFVDDEASSEPVKPPWGLVAGLLLAVAMTSAGVWQILERRAGRDGTVVRWNGIETSMSAIEVPPIVPRAPGAAPAGRGRTTVVLSARPVVRVAAPAPPPKPAAPESAAPSKLEIRARRPEASSLRVIAGRSQEFGVELARGDAKTLEWQIDGEPVARGTGFVLETLPATEAGPRVVAVVGPAQGKPEVLAAWRLDVASPIQFVEIAPREEHASIVLGETLSLRADAAIEPSEPLSYRWTVDGSGDEQASSPAFSLRPREPGQAIVRVGVTARSGASLERTWTITVAPPAAVAAAEAKAWDWVRGYCAAFERRDREGLAALADADVDGALAAAERESAIHGACAATVRVVADQGVVVIVDRAIRSFDQRGARTDHRLPTLERVFADPAGRPIGAELAKRPR